jgi:hypothetical protein
LEITTGLFSKDNKRVDLPVLATRKKDGLFDNVTAVPSAPTQVNANFLARDIAPTLIYVSMRSLDSMTGWESFTRMTNEDNMVAQEIRIGKESS